MSTEEWIPVINKKKTKNKTITKPVYYIDEKYHKKILCNNVLANGSCGYGKKCLYAHNLAEQTAEPIRKTAYDIIKSTNTINNSDISKTLLDNFLVLTRTCHECEKNKCPGGYNCRWGAVSKQTTVCYNDLLYGVCTFNNCSFVHLTKRGLNPITPKPKKMEDIYSFNSSLDDEITNIVQDVPQANLLNSDFLINVLGKDNIDLDLSDDEKEIDKDIKTALIDSIIDLCDKSIFD